MGSAALNLCWVADGRLDGYYEHDTKLYDYAAGALIAAEAGAQVELPVADRSSLSLGTRPGLFLEGHHRCGTASESHRLRNLTAQQV